MTTELAQNKNPLSVMSDRLSIDPQELQNIVFATVMPNGGKAVTNEQFVSFMAVANNYNLDPLKKEIYAFPAKGGGIQPIVSIDGWLGIINSHPQFDGMTLEESFDDKGVIFSVTCSIYRKDRAHPTVITEYLAECIRNTEPWKKKIRMLRHKAVIQCGRYTFGLSGIMEQDEAEAAIERDITPKKSTLNIPDDVDTETGEIITSTEDGYTIPEAEEHKTQPDVSMLKELMDGCESKETLAAAGATIAEHNWSIEELADLRAYYANSAKRFNGSES